MDQDSTQQDRDGSRKMTHHGVDGKDSGGDCGGCDDPKCERKRQ